MHNNNTFVLLSGADDLRYLGELLLEYGLLDVTIKAGYNLTYEDEEVMTLSPDKCLRIDKQGLYVALLINQNARERIQIKLIDDESFIREHVPMTKSEIRHFCVMKLGLGLKSVVFDIGSGTGSVAIEIAKQYLTCRVFAIEKKEAAIELINKNCEHFNAKNVTVIKGMAPIVLKEIKIMPTHAFIGGSSKEMENIVRYLLEINPKIRIVATAVSVEGIAMLNNIYKEYLSLNSELICLSVSRAKQLAGYSMMEGSNPVYILSMGGNND